MDYSYLLHGLIRASTCYWTIVAETCHHKLLELAGQLTRLTSSLCSVGVETDLDCVGCRRRNIIHAIGSVGGNKEDREHGKRLAQEACHGCAITALVYCNCRSIRFQVPRQSRQSDRSDLKESFWKPLEVLLLRKKTPRIY